MPVSSTARRLLLAGGILVIACAAVSGSAAVAASGTLYAARADTQVTYQNSADCQRALSASGRAVPLVDPGRLDHFPSERADLPRVLAWFDRLQPSAAGGHGKTPRSNN